MPILAPEEPGKPVIVRWPAWAVVATIALAGAWLFVGFQYMRGRYVAGGSPDLTLLLFGALVLAHVPVTLLAKRRARPPQRPS